MEQAGAAADVNRLSDEDETRLTMALGSSGSTDGEAGPALPADARPRGRLPRDPRLRGRGGGGRGPPPRGRRAAAGRGRGVARAPARARRGTAAASPPRTCATSCSTAACSWTRSRRPPPGRTSAKLHGAVREALRAVAVGPGHAAARHVPRLAPVSVGRLPLLHLPGPPGGRRARPVAGGEDRGLGGDRGRRRHDHPPPRDRPRPPPLAGAPRTASSASRCCAPPRSGSTPPGS